MWEHSRGIREHSVERAIELIVSTMPVQTIVAAFCADQFLRKLVWEAGRRVPEIFLFCFDQVLARILGGEFILADAPEHDFVSTGVGVEIPLTLIIHEGNRKGPIFGTHDQGYRTVRLCHEPMHRLVSDNEAGTGVRVLRWIA